MSEAKKKYITFSVFDYLLTFGGSATVILYNYIVPGNSMGYKLSLTGILLFVLVLFIAKSIFEKHYREKLDSLLQQLAEASDPEVKKVISKDIEAHKVKNNVYERLMLLLPFIILVFVTTAGIKWLDDLRATSGLILTSMGAGSVFNILKKPQRDKVKAENYKKKAKK